MKRTLQLITLIILIQSIAASAMQQEFKKPEVYPCEGFACNKIMGSLKAVGDHHRRHLRNQASVKKMELPVKSSARERIQTYNNMQR